MIAHTLVYVGALLQYIECGVQSGVRSHKRACRGDVSNQSAAPPRTSAHEVYTQPGARAASGKMAFVCLLSEDEREAVRRSRQIDRQLQQEKKSLRQEIKILLLGAGESGKSTFIKQMRIIHGQEYTKEEQLEFRSLIYHNVLKGMKILVEARKRLAIPLQEARNEACSEVVTGYRRAGDSELTPEMFAEFVEALRSLWKDGGIQATFKRSNEFQLVRREGGREGREAGRGGRAGGRTSLNK